MATEALAFPGAEADGSEVLAAIQDRVLWLATRIVDAANHDRPPVGGLKVGGHQASCASMVSIMTSLWFAHLRGADRVSVKPHASPVLHAIQYLLGGLDRSYLTRLREKDGLQSYPSRTKDPDRVDFSTGSVGLGAVAPLFASATRRYVNAHFGTREVARFVALLGDAELDEGSVWEAAADPATAGLGDVMWVVDFNRQSLDRVVPGVRIDQWRGQFEALGWHCVEVKYGRLLTELFDRPGGAALRTWIDAMPNEHYQSLFALSGQQLRLRFLQEAPDAVSKLVDDIDDEDLPGVVQDLGGHDPESLLKAYRACDAVTDRPSVVFAYTVKGWGLPVAGNPRNHAALLPKSEIEALRDRLDLTEATEWSRFAATSEAGRLIEQRKAELHLEPAGARPSIMVPNDTGIRPGRPVSTQDTFGRVLSTLSRDENVGPRLVTTAPDVASSTNLGGFINRTGVFAPKVRTSWSEDELLKWEEGPTGQHLELGISEMNLFMLLGQLGLAHELSNELLLPVGTVYDPFVCRGLDALIYSVYSGARFLFAGTPSGITLAPEGGAHQSTITASIGMELPNLTALEPAYAGALDVLLCDALGRIANPDDDEHGAYYLRLSTRAIDQTPFEQARVRLGDVLLRRQVLAGAYRLIDPDAGFAETDSAPRVHLAASGAVMPEVVEAANVLSGEGVAATVVDVTSGDRLYCGWQKELRRGIRTATSPAAPAALRAVFRDRVPIVTVHDASSHTLAWLGSALGVPAVPLGVERFGESGSIPDLYAEHDLDSGSIVNAALAALALA